MQKIILTGNLTADARKVEPKSGADPFVSFSIAVNEKRSEQETTTFYEVTYRLTGAFEHLTKGKQVLVEGRPELNVYTTKDNAPAGQIVVRAHTLELL